MSQIKYATVQNPTIAAVIGGKYRFKQVEQALSRLQIIKKNFIISKEPLENEESGLAVKLWIKGFTSKEEEANRYLGNYAIVRVLKLKADLFTLKAEKVEKPIHLHPQRVRPQKKTPNWGNPMLRQIKKGKVFARLADAERVLENLHKDFPDVTIPLDLKMYIIIFERSLSPPVQKYILTIKPDSKGMSGGFIIDYEINRSKPVRMRIAEDKPKLPPMEALQQESETLSEPEAQRGYHTALLEIKRKIKSNKSARRKTISREED